MKVSKFLFNLSAVICYFVGVLYIFSLVFIPIGVYCFIAAKRFAFKAENLLDFNLIPNNILKNYVIFASIACFPLGLISIIPYLLISSNNIKVESTQDNKENNIVVENIEDVENKEDVVEEVKVNTEETENEKQDKFNKLKQFHEKGIITDDELEMAREQLFGNKDK